MSGITFARSFSRPGLAMIRLSQEEGATAVPRASESGLIFKSALLMSFLGVGFSMFSMSQLQDTRAASRPSRFDIKKS